MAGVCVRVQQARLAAIVSVIGLAATAVVSFSTPAEARRSRHKAHQAQKGGGYAPAYAAMVVDAKTGRTLHAVNEDAPRHPASVTKVMTLYLLFEAMESGRVTLATEMPVSAHAAAAAPSKLYLKPGETISVEDAIGAMVTKSANDVAVTTAEFLGGSEDGFAERMTRKAKQLGMGRTRYVNASGLPDPEQITTARDLTILARAIQERFPKQYKYFQTRVWTYAGRPIRNHNRLLGKVEGVDGIKTGFTNASGFNLMTSVRTGDRHLVGVVLGGRSAGLRDKQMAALIQANLPRAYAGAKTVAPIVDGARPTALAEAREPQTRETPSREIPSRETSSREPSSRDTKAREAETETPATTASTRPARSETSPIRPVVASVAGGSTATPSQMPRWSVGPQALPAGAQAYAALPPDPAARFAPVAATPTGKIDARLPAPAPLPPKAETKSEPAVRAEAKVEPKPEPKAEAKADKPAPRRESATEPASDIKSRPAQVTSWVIQLGATEEENEAKSLLEGARPRLSGYRKAAPFTEKVVHGGATLYRARFSGFTEADSAQDACKMLKKNGFSCFATRS